MGSSVRPAGMTVDSAQRQLSRRAVLVGLWMRHCVILMVTFVTLADPHSIAQTGGRLLLAVAAAWSLRRVLTRDVGPVSSVIDYALVIAVCLAIPLIAPDPGFMLFNSAPLAIAGTAVVSFAVSGAPRWSLPATVGVAAAYACGGAAVLGWDRIGSVAALYYFALQWAAAAAIRLMVLRIARAVDQARAQRLSAELDQQTSEAVRSFDREQLALLHDTAASTLMMAGQGAEISPERLAQQARRDLELLENGPWRPPPERMEVVGALRECAAHLRTPVEFSGLPELWVDGEIAQPAVAAAREVMNNVDRHADAALLRITVAREAILLEDNGIGFDPSAPRAGRGVTDSILGRMQRAGGHAEIRSTPGEGTEVELSWGAGQLDDQARRARMDPDRLIERIRIGYGLAILTYALLNLAFAVPYADAYGGRDRMDNVLVVVAVLSTLAALPGIVRRNWFLVRPAALGLAVVTILQPLLLPPELVGGHAHWAQNAVGWCVVPLLLTLPTGLGVAILTGYWVLGSVVELICQPTSAVLTNIGLGTASILSIQIFALVFNGLVRDAAVAAHRETEVHRMLAARERIQDAVRAEYQRRYASLVRNVVPLLRELTAGTPVDPDLQRRARTESRRMRALFDQAAIFGHPLMQSLRDLIDDAEARGVEVTVDLAGDLPDLAGGQIAEIVEALRRVTGAARTVLRMVVTGTAEEATVSIVTDRGDGSAVLVEDMPGSADLDVIASGDMVWVEARIRPVSPVVD